MKTSEANGFSLRVVAYVRTMWRRVRRGRFPDGTVSWAEPKSSQAGGETWLEHLRFAVKRAKAALGACGEQAEVAKILAKHNTALKADLDRARQRIEHLRRIEAAYLKVTSKMEELDDDPSRRVGTDQRVATDTVRDGGTAAGQGHDRR